MVYGIIELINFAHGDVFMVGAFASMFVLINILGQNTSSSATSVPQAVFLIAATFAIVMPAMGLLGVAIERFAYRPLRNAPRLAPLITAIGVSFILQNFIQIIYGPSPINTPQVIPPSARVEVGNVEHRRDQRVRDRRLGGPDDRAPAVRQPDAAGPRDAVDRLGP